jgi:hypothetical protein
MAWKVQHHNPQLISWPISWVVVKVGLPICHPTLLTCLTSIGVAVH